MEVLCDSESSTARCLAGRSPSAAESDRTDQHEDRMEDDTARSSSTDSELGQLTCKSDYSSSEDEEEDEEEEEEDDEEGDLTTATAGNSAYGCYGGGDDEPGTDKDTGRAAGETEGEGEASSNDGEVTSRDYSELIEKRFQKLYGLKTPVSCRVLDEEWCDQILPIKQRQEDDETPAEGGQTLEQIVCASWPVKYRSQQDVVTSETLKSEAEKSNENHEDSSSTDTDSENEGQYTETDGQYPENFTVDIDAEQQEYSRGYKMPKDGQVTDSSNWNIGWDPTEDQFDHPFRFLSLINKLAAMNDLVVVSSLMDASSRENKPCFGGYRRTPVERCIIEEIDENSDNENTQKTLVSNVTSDSGTTSTRPVAQKMPNHKHKTSVEAESTAKDIHFNVLAQSKPQPDYKHNIINESSHGAGEINSNFLNDSTNPCRSPSRKGRGRSSPRSLKCCHRLSKSDGDSSIRTKNCEPASKKHTLSGKVQANKSSDCNCQLDGRGGGKTTKKLNHRSLEKTELEQGELDTTLPRSKGQTAAETRELKKGAACQKPTASKSSTKDPASTANHTQPSATRLPFIKANQLDGTAQPSSTGVVPLNMEKHYAEVVAAYKPKGKSAVKGLQSHQKQALIGRLLTLPTRKKNGSNSMVRLPSLLEQPAPAHRRSHPLALRRPATPPNRNVLASRAQWPQFSTKQPCHAEGGTSKRINFRDMPTLKKVPGFSYGVYE